MSKMPDTSQYLLESVGANRSGKRRGVASFCSANRFVLQAAMIEAKERGNVVCIESTSNQVNQFGGYSGMTAADFAAFANDVARETGLPSGRILLGGDHLGPFPWQGENAEAAMAKAGDLVRTCVLAGYTKIHLDTSMRCADDPGGSDSPLCEKTATGRAAFLCEIAEAAYASLPPGSPAPLYVIGTEVPVPGGEQEESHIRITRTVDLQRTIELTRRAFESRGLSRAWQRVVAVVVQPGVEFGDTTIVEYDRLKARELSSWIRTVDGLVYEAHSTDYQTPLALRQMVEDHFAILKVGPWLTFAAREALFALEEMEVEWLPGRRGITLSGVRHALESAMLENPRHWQKYYRGSEAELRFARSYSFSDRCRYYWPQPGVQQAVQRLLRNLSENPVPLTLLSQFMPDQYRAVREGRLKVQPADLVRDRVARVLAIYADACGTATDSTN
jgi:D-tagatose-1,6-bisphosphate aldolase subunit GatZ/KbaZ